MLKLEDSAALRARILDDVMSASNGGAVPLSRDWLADYTVDGVPLPLIDKYGRGIRNSGDWQHTVSITTVEKGRYPDREAEPGVWHYPYCIDKHGQVDSSNRKLANATRDGVPVLYFYKPFPGTYLFIGQVMPIANSTSEQEFTVALMSSAVTIGGSASLVERAWVKQTVERRLHQPRFRAIVMDAYASRCAICALPEASLLDAAHIRGDKDPNGQPVVENGLALCSIHHRAYDGHQIGIDEDLKLHVRPDVLKISDGPVLEHAIQRLGGTTLSVVPPRGKRPDPYRLGLTFKEFLASA